MLDKYPMHVIIQGSHTVFTVNGKLIQAKTVLLLSKDTVCYALVTLMGLDKH